MTGQQRRTVARYVVLARLDQGDRGGLATDLAEQSEYPIEPGDIYKIYDLAARATVTVEVPLA